MQKQIIKAEVKRKRKPKANSEASWRKKRIGLGVGA